MQQLLPHGPARQLTPMRWKSTEGSLLLLDVRPPLTLRSAEAGMDLALLATIQGKGRIIIYHPFHFHTRLSTSPEGSRP